MNLLSNFETRSFVRKIAKSAAIGCIYILASACTTTGSETAKVNDGLTNERQPVIQRAANPTNASLSGNDRDYWLELRGKGEQKQKIVGLLASGDYENAANEARLYLQARPGDLWGLKMLASALAVSKQFELANYYATLIEEQSPNDADVMNIRAIAILTSASIEHSDYFRALSLFEQTFEQNSNHVASGINLADLYLRLGNVEKAKQTYGAVLTRRANVLPAQLGYGIACNSLGDYKEAEVVLGEVLKKEPNEADALYHLALVYKNGYNNSKEAEKYLNRIIALQGEQFHHKRERANAILQAMRGEAIVDQEVASVSKKDATKTNDESSTGNEDLDLHLLMVDEEVEETAK
ncbi:MAG: tetratricopeptide repeat protein [Oligoflexales bacterium]|nr:tetratricopeptide repeat protein [Oligoflexales bacterium]